jgi:transposase/uncharacterized coiled-coil protein SlyX
MTPREAQLERDKAHLRATVAELHAALADLRATVEKQQAHLDRLVRMTFGRSSERAIGPTLFDAVTPSGDTPVPVPPEPGRSASSSRRRGHGRRRISADLPVERVEIDLPEAEKVCPCCGDARVRIGASEPSRRHDYRPASVFIRETVRFSYACRRCEQAGRDPQFARPPLPPEPIERSAAAAGLLAHVVVSKFVDHLPLHRLEAVLGRHGLAASRSTLCDWVRGCAAALDPVYRAMVGRVKRSHAIHADETPVTLLRPRRTAYAWAYLGDATNPFTVFDLTAGRSQDFPARFLGGFAGFVHSDAYAGYHPVHGGTRHVGCWMHARRGFHDARAADPRAAEALAFVRALYDVERRIAEAGLRDEAVAAFRRGHARPTLDAFATWLTEQKRAALPASAFGQAVTYAVNQWPHTRAVRRRPPVGDRQRPGRAGDPPAGARPKELALRGRRRRPPLGRRPPERGGQRQAARARLVGLPVRSVDPPPGPTAECRRVRPPPRPVATVVDPATRIPHAVGQT